MKRLPWRLVLLVLPALAACHTARAAGAAGAPDAAPRASAFDLVGVVRDEASGRALAGVLVVADALAGHRAVTDAAGAYRIAGLPRGRYVVSARKIGYYVERREVASECPAVVVDSTGRPVGGGGPCDPSPQGLNFYLRAHTVY